MQSFPEKKRIFHAFRLAFPEQWAILAEEKVSGASRAASLPNIIFFINKPKQERNPEP
ncbi:MAG: hypothetical protein IKQ16_00760 [Lentisphaeria bacterium]|nr:hypothetical protein [Lentisphaeria bacterium]